MYGNKRDSAVYLPLQAPATGLLLFVTLVVIHLFLVDVEAICEQVGALYLCHLLAWLYICLLHLLAIIFLG